MASKKLLVGYASTIQLAMNYSGVVDAASDCYAMQLIGAFTGGPQ